jgi:hypothetical protein
MMVDVDFLISGLANHDNPSTCSSLSFGELLQSKDYALKQIRSVHSRLKWGKGLSAINHQIWELIDKERENRFQKPTLYQFWLWAQETMSTKTTAMAAPGVAGLLQLQEASPSRRCALSVGQKQERSPLRLWHGRWGKNRSAALAVFV